MPRDRRHQLPRPTAALLAAVGVAGSMALLVGACNETGFTLSPDAAGGWLIAVLFAVYAVATKPVIRVERGVCACCGARPAQLYICGWRCEAHSPAAVRAATEGATQ